MAEQRFSTKKALVAYMRQCNYRVVAQASGRVTFEKHDMSHAEQQWRIWDDGQGWRRAR